ncbi:MAG TPA: cytochrome c biogenesis protein CcdA [Candidatus Kapabacteria bacterium]|nr:cytochrome c biogenesis protein CcdA [Candidatus Kapabacteria bacterium]
MKKNPFILVVLLAAASFLSKTDGYAQSAKSLREKFANDSSILTLSVDPNADISQAKIFEAKVHFKIGKGWHIYSSKSSDEAGYPMKIGIPDELKNSFEVVGVSETGKTVSVFDSNFMATTVSHYTDFDAIVKVKVKASAAVGSSPFYLWVFYQTCNESNCIPPNTYTAPQFFLGKKPLQLTIKENTGKEDAATQDTTSVATAAPSMPSALPPTSSAPAGADATNADSLNKLAHTSIWEFIFAAIGFGLLALVTPCVFPMIPITVSFFTKRNQGSKRHVIQDAIFYAVGIIGTFVALGFLLALVMGPAGINKFAANPLVNAFVAVVFLAFALNLFGLFELGVPSSVLSKLNMRATTSKNKITSVILMGFVFSLTSFTCTVPFVGTLMVSFSHGEWFVPLVGMTVFASVFALPFFLLALFPSAMKALPKSGGWLNSVKVVMGFLEIAAALKFISNMDLVYKWGIFTRDFVLAAWIAIMIVTTFYLLGRFSLPHDTPSQHIGPIRAVFSVIFLTFGIYLFTGLGGKTLGELDGFLPPMLDNTSVTTAGIFSPSTGVKPAGDLHWYPRYSEALAEAKRTGKNVFIDFTGYQCTNCRSMEATIFKQMQVKDLFKQYVLARLYADDGSALNDSNRTMEETRFSTIAQPYYAILSPDDKPLATFPGFTRDLPAFLAFLKPYASESQPRQVASLGVN